MKQCPVATCFTPEATCALGHLKLTDCPEWTGSGEKDAAVPESSDEIILPWSGAALGRTDVGFVAGRAKPMMVSLVGPENAGKTTLLAAWYLLVGRGVPISDRHRFAGSFTLSGWEAVARSLQWAPGSPPEFPAHTSTRGGRGQGLLHFAFREDDERLRDYLFTDAPGLWFQKWAMNEEAGDAAGARWIFERADLFLLLADCAALSGQERGSARSAIQVLARRVGASRRGRPVILVWAKSDIQLPAEIEKSVRDAVKSQIPDMEEFSVSMRAQPEGDEGRGVGLTTLLEKVLQFRRLKQTLPSARGDSSDPLFLFGVR
jgi:hypothetical protein